MNTSHTKRNVVQPKLVPGRGCASRWARFAAIALPGILCLVFASSAFAAQTWRLDAASNSTVAPGDTFTYLVQPANIGDGDMDGSQIDVLATLDPNMTAVDATMIVDPLNNGRPIPCTAGDGVSPVAGATTVRCSTTMPVPAAVNSGGTDYMAMTLTVRAGPFSSGTLKSFFDISGGGATPTRTVDWTVVTSGPPEFGVDSFDGVVSANAAGDPLTQAGGHPFDAAVSIDFNTTTNPVPLAGILWPVEPVKDVVVDLPPGLVGDPTAAERCTAGQLANGYLTGAAPLCAPTSQVGTALVRINGAPTIASPFGPVPVFNMVPPPNVPARFGFNVLGSVVVLDAQLRSGGDYGLTVVARDVPEALAIAGTTMTFWGVPASPDHDAQRACPGLSSPALGAPSCRSGAPLRAFLRNPTSCPDPGVGLATTARIDSWGHPGDFVEKTWISHNLPGYPLAPEDWGSPQGTTGCARVPFAPSFAAAPVSGKAGSPAGFAFDVSLPQTDDPDVIAQADLRRAVVTLPAGVRVSPSSADGLGACAPSQIHLHDDNAPTCPDSSKIGTMTIKTPLLDDLLTGAIYLAKPNDNPFGSLLSTYLVAEGPGVVVKLAGKVDADPISGQLTATFDDNPQLPFSNLHLEFKGGPRAALVTPKQCGTYTTNAELTSWSGKVVAVDSSFSVSHDGNGAPCPASQFSPDFSASTEDPVAGKSSPFNLEISRGDDDEELHAVTVDMPNGLTGKIANVPLCSESDAKTGSCPESSRVGSVTVGAGAGSDPFYITNGRAYLTGSYRGAPFGLSIVVPAVAGPFDLGNVVVRSSISVDKHTAELRVVSDPLPTILQGIPLDVRDVRVSVDKADFIVNPTSCAEKQIAGSIESVDGKTAKVSSRFQVGDCGHLPLTPKMTLTVGGRGHTNRGGSTPLTATLTQTPGQSNLRSVRVVLPSTINARLTVINDACTRAAFEAGQCEKARAGMAVAKTPLLKDPLRGAAYFVRNGNRLPDLFVALRGQVPFDLIGRITIPGSKRLATTFDQIPDVPISSFSLSLVSGRDGSVGTAANLCSARARRAKAELDFVGQNGKVKQVDQALNIQGCGRRGRPAKAKKANHRRGGHRRR